MSRKRKAAVSSCDGTEPATSLCSIPDVAWEAIASFASPPDAYCLALTSRHFHAAEDKGDDPVLATKMLRASLFSSLRRVLASSETGITLDAALKLADLPEGSVVITGSTMVQACLGTFWGEGSCDVDIFVTARAAPAVRSWLVEETRSMFCGFKDYRISMEDKTLAYTVDTKIHHVEQFGTIPEDDPDDWLKARIKFGRNVQKNYADWKWRNTLPEVGISDIGKDYHIKPLKGHDLPFDFDMDSNIDLIVAKKECTTASELLVDFDLNICRASFDGKTFRIPDPHLAFAGKSAMEPNRKALVESYIMHSPKDEPHWSGSLYNQVERVRATITAVRAEYPDLPFYRLVDIANSIKINGTEDVDDYEIMWNNNRKRKMGLAFQFHNFVAKLVDRLNKYQRRGIEVVDGPSIGETKGLMEAHFIY